ncbi:MAG: aminotransferase class III-fold pyridoxal phosphate-dependent enzyme [Solirubrobacterales bacterium]
MVRGEGVRLFDRDGVEYLDAYNNVPCVGHAHPRVVAAIAEQAATLNTHTRYLAEPILDYAERLLASLGVGLGHVMLTCTGSEANDLALRIARFETGRAGVVVTANAYHGVTEAVAEASPSLGRAVAPGPRVRTIAPPMAEAADPIDEGERLAADLDAAVEELDRAGHGLAAVLIDPIFASDGLRPYPTGVLAPLAAAVRAHGGLLIADEVQAGFGRTGGSMWGFQRHGVEPDLVTMGKPMGNGMPIGGVAVRPQLVSRFGREVRYFNTFGGSSVSVAAAAATLDVIAEERLMENAAVVGHHLEVGLGKLAERHPALRRVRGCGLYLAADVVAPPGPATTAAAVVDGLRQRKILIGTAGPGGTALKIRPPLVFSEGACGPAPRSPRRCPRRRRQG